jgi:rhodanese-related sulfurtransferase/rubrerythrin
MSAIAGAKLERPMLQQGLTHAMSPDELRRLMSQGDERSYVVIDVRQPKEYALGHIPGSRLMPLPEIESHREELSKLSGRTLVFYCRSGARSDRAALYAASALRLPHVHKLDGGFASYSGQALPNFPRLKAIDPSQGRRGILEQALNLEKGTARLYRALEKKLGGSEVGRILGHLVTAELNHSRSLYDSLVKLTRGPSDGFDALFDRLDGNLTEDGEAVESILERADMLGKDGNLSLLELALEIELSAYDLYKSLALEVLDADSREVLMTLAQEEKVHARHVASSLESAAIGASRANTAR